MVFASITFLYWFLPVVVLGYFLLPKRWRNGWLLVTSLFFYGWGAPKTLILLAASVAVGYGMAFALEACEGAGKIVWKKILLWLAIIMEVGCLIYFKYANFFLENVNRWTGGALALLKIVLPVGISFYTFQIISYIVDVYRGTEKAQRNIIDFAMYICLFTQLVAGPIVRYSDIAGQLRERDIKASEVKLGIRRVILGLSKKVLLADLLGEFCETVKDFQESTVVALWLSAIAFTLQIYFDFSGYSDMAIGLGRIFGFRFPENFRYPYAATSITDFWRRWHMTLTQWFRDYIYIPLGGNRCKKWKWICNIFIVWMLTGFWHGAEWNFVLWGLYFAVILLVEKLTNSGKVQTQKCPWWKTFLKHGYVILLVVIGFVIFEETDIFMLGQRLGGMFGLGNLAVSSEATWYYARSYGLLFLFGIIGCIPVGKWLIGKIENQSIGKRILVVAEPVAWIVLLLLSTAYLVDGSYHPFLYFRF
ncbi:MAG: MBOAT family protein [Lachnospiraceae bacterium]|nr:MBOAT family protein [Lachnospiraceae bacterium]